MRVLITNRQSRLGTLLARTLGRSHEIRTLDRRGGPADGSAALVGDPRDREVAAAAVEGCDAVVHLGLLEAEEASDEDALDAATRGTYNLITTATTAQRFVLISSLSPFERYPYEYRVNEYWAPRPTTDVADLAPYLAELTVREVARVAPLKAITLRLGTLVDDANVASRPADSRWLHLADAVQAVERALAFEPRSDGPQTGWWVFHVPGGGARPRFPLGLAGQPPFDYAPGHDVTSAAPIPVAAATEPRPRLDSRRAPSPPRRVVVFGAGGPLAAVTTEALVHDHVLRLTDARPLAEIVAANQPQSPGAPVPRLLGPPHEIAVVDVTDPAQVREAARGMDAIVNCTVVRPHPVEAFRVNTIGAFNVMRAAVAEGIRRVVHTGPQQVTLPYPAGYWYDFALSDDVPSRPGANLYILTKFLGQEICRVFAEEHGIEVPALLFSSFVNPANPPPEPLGAFPFSVSWEDAAQAMRLALHAPAYPHPFEVFHLLGDLPHGKYRNEKARTLLGWQPRDRLESHWTRPTG